MFNEKPVVNYVSQPAPVVPAADTQSAAFQAAVAAAVKIALAQQAPAAPASGGELNQKLIEVLLKKEAREADAEHQKEIIKQTKQLQAGLNAQSTEQEKREKQRRCKHIKGGKLQKKGIKDWNVSSHRFVDGTEVIKCHTCTMRWRERDTKDFLYRGENVRNAEGREVAVIRKYRNHTGIGWHEAKQMVEDSTNESTRSEIVMVASPQAMQAAAISENLQRQVANEVDTYGKPVEETAAPRFSSKAPEVADDFAKPVEESVQQ
jgi:ribosomal protein L7/L12